MPPTDSRLDADVEPTSFDAAIACARALARDPDAPWEDRVDAYERALALGEEQGADARAMALAYNEIGGLCMERGGAEVAVEAFERACAHDPTLPFARANLGGALSAAGDHAGAVAALREAVALAPGETAYLEVLARELRLLRRDDEAAAVYARWYALAPEDPVAAHHALHERAPPAKASAAYLRREFDGFSERFDATLRDALEYRGPELVAAAARAVLGDAPRDLVVGDLGCGTGLCAPALRPWARRLVGVDLSPGMLLRAAGRGYDERIESDIARYCEGAPDTFDLLVAADVIIYLGALEPLMRAALRALVPGGVFAFTAEQGADAARGWTLRVDGRYRHTGEYLDGCLDAAGFERVQRTAAVLRRERGEPVQGWVVAARRRGA